MKREQSQVDRNKIAPGMADEEELNKDATLSDIAEGDTTKVVRLSFDEVDPS